MNPFGEPVVISEKPTQVAMCFNKMMHIAELKATLKALEESVANQGAKIVSVKFGKNVRLNDIRLHNPWNNKCVIEITKRKFDEPVISETVWARFMDFFGGCEE